MNVYDFLSSYFPPPLLGFFLGLFGPCAWFLPVVSLVLYLVWRNDKPKTAAAIGKFTVIGLIVGLSLFILASIIILQRDYVCRISHTEPGMPPRAYFKDLKDKFRIQIEEITDSIANI